MGQLLSAANNNLRLLSPKEFRSKVERSFSNNKPQPVGDYIGIDDPLQQSSSSSSSFKPQILIQKLPNVGTCRVAFLSDGTIAGTLSLDSCSTLFSLLLQQPVLLSSSTNQQHHHHQDEHDNTIVIKIPIRGSFFIDRDDNFDISIRDLVVGVSFHDREEREDSGSSMSTLFPNQQQQQRLYWDRFSMKIRPVYHQRLGDDQDEERTFRIEFVDDDLLPDANDFLPEQYKKQEAADANGIDEEKNTDYDSNKNRHQNNKKQSQQPFNNKPTSSHHHHLTQSQAAMVMALDALVTELGVAPVTTSASRNALLENSSNNRNRSLLLTSADNNNNTDAIQQRNMLLNEIAEENELQRSPIDFLRNMKKGRNFRSQQTRNQSSSSSRKINNNVNRSISNSNNTSSKKNSSQNSFSNSHDASSSGTSCSDDEDGELLEDVTQRSSAERKSQKNSRNKKNDDSRRLFSVQTKIRNQNRQSKKLFARLGGTFLIPKDEASLRKVFESFDLDGTGYIDREEFAECYMDYENNDMGLSCFGRKDVDAIFERIDKNHDSKLSFNEFQLFMLQRASY